MAGNATDESWGHLERRRYALQDRDTKFCAKFRATLASGGIRPIQVTSQESESKRFRGAMGTLSEAGVPVELEVIFEVSA